MTDHIHRSGRSVLPRSGGRPWRTVRGRRTSYPGGCRNMGSAPLGQGCWDGGGARGGRGGGGGGGGRGPWLKGRAGGGPGGGEGGAQHGIVGGGSVREG